MALRGALEATGVQQMYSVYNVPRGLMTWGVVNGQEPKYVTTGRIVACQRTGCLATGQVGSVNPMPAKGVYLGAEWSRACRGLSWSWSLRT